jgi:hypothetical protein
MSDGKEVEKFRSLKGIGRLALGIGYLLKARSKK